VHGNVYTSTVSIGHVTIRSPLPCHFTHLQRDDGLGLPKLRLARHRDPAGPPSTAERRGRVIGAMSDIVKTLTIKTGKNSGEHPSVVSLYRALRRTLCLPKMWVCQDNGVTGSC
jgi:hypothetical protein